MKGKDLYRNMSLIDETLIEKNSKESYRSHKPLMISLIAAALAISLLAVFILPAMQSGGGENTEWQPPVFTDDTDAATEPDYRPIGEIIDTGSVTEDDQTEPDYRPVGGAKFQYLTAQTFAPSREAGKISDEFREVAAHFAFELLKNSKDSYEGDGLLVSPLSAMLALAMTANGAEGETLAEMERTLAGGMYIGRLNQELFDYTSSLVSTDDAKFNLANAVYLTSDSRFSVNNNFLKSIENTFDADVVSVDMRDPLTVDAINDWVKKETFGMIDSIVKKTDITPETVMVLINALAFDALWASQVGDESCFTDTFNGKDTAIFMNTSCNAYIKGDNEEGIVKNYKGGKYAFVALLPDKGIDIDDYMESLDGTAFLKLYDQRERSGNNIQVNVTAKMPHFSYDCSLKLKDVLNNMGLSKAFDPDNAEFGSLGKWQDGNIFIGQVLQKTHIDLDNSGTRAAAVTAVTMIGTTSVPTQVKNYRVELDRPFVYAIVDTSTGLPIFLGACENIK